MPDPEIFPNKNLYFNEVAKRRRILLDQSLPAFSTMPVDPVANILLERQAEEIPTPTGPAENSPTVVVDPFDKTTNTSLKTNQTKRTIRKRQSMMFENDSSYPLNLTDNNEIYNNDNNRDDALIEANEATVHEIPRLALPMVQPSEIQSQSQQIDSKPHCIIINGGDQNHHSDIFNNTTNNSDNELSKLTCRRTSLYFV